MRFVFPFADIKKASRIVLYGASEEGYDFYRQIVSTGYCHVVLWVDRQYEWWRTMNLPVEAPECIKGAAFDLVVLTAEKRSVADSMIKDLKEFGIDQDKIFWKEDCTIKGNIAAGYDSDRIMKEAAEAVLVDPRDYLNERSLDIIVRVLYARDIAHGIENERHEAMYKRLMMEQNNGKEPTEDMIHSYFTEYSIKRGWKAFDQSFHELVDSMQRDGFERESFIPVDSKGNLINGRHRLAVALALSVDVFVRKYPFDGFNFCFDREWLKGLGFSEEKIAEVVEEYQGLLRG